MGLKSLEGAPAERADRVLMMSMLWLCGAGEKGRKAEKQKETRLTTARATLFPHPRPPANRSLGSR